MEHTRRNRNVNHRTSHMMMMMVLGIGVTHSIFTKIFDILKLDSRGYRVALFA